MQKGGRRIDDNIWQCQKKEASENIGTWKSRTLLNKSEGSGGVKNLNKLFRKKGLWASRNGANVREKSNVEGKAGERAKG